MTDVEREELLSSPVRRWGRQWQLFMEENYPEDVPALKESGRWQELCDEIECEAYDLRNTLREQFWRVKPRPMDGFLEIVQWENELKMLTERQILEDLVCVCRG